MKHILRYSHGLSNDDVRQISLIVEVFENHLGNWCIADAVIRDNRLFVRICKSNGMRVEQYWREYPMGFMFLTRQGLEYERELNRI